jgi:hypothetical protein
MLRDAVLHTAPQHEVVFGLVLRSAKRVSKDEAGVLMLRDAALARGSSA